MVKRNDCTIFVKISPMKKLLPTLLILLILPDYGLAQCSGWGTFTALTDTFYNPAFGNGITPERDRLSRPYVYLAAKASGIKIFDISGPNPTQTAAVTFADLGNADAINLHQDSIWLYVTLGDIWNTTQESGMAIVDVSDPTSPVVLDVYDHPNSTGGAGAVSVRGDYAYLAGMGTGLIILNIANKSDIQFVSVLPLVNTFPHSTLQQGNDEMYNARGIALKDDHAFITYDRGGLRVVDISNVNAPTQVEAHCYAPLIDHATAYNNVVIHGDLAFVAMDYYGMEILDISDPLDVTQVSYWRPATWPEATNDILVWSNAEGHANELAYDPACKNIYLAAGKSDVISIDVSDPANPTTCETFGTPSDDYGTWGLDFFDGKVYIAYIYSPLFPPHSFYTGFREIAVSCTPVGLVETTPNEALTLYPNPFTDQLTLKDAPHTMMSISVIDLLGRTVYHTTTQGATTFNLPALQNGLYTVRVQGPDFDFSQKVIKE